MKLTIQGSSLANHLKPLAVNVRQHEGTDYDRISLSINAEDGKNYLKARVEQPTYTAFMHLNLSGMGTKADDEEVKGADPIDAYAEACADGELYSMKASDMSNVNRNVGASTGTYSFDRDRGFHVLVGKTIRLAKDTQHADTELFVPRQTVDQEKLATDPDNWFMPMASVSAGPLYKALNAAIHVCRLTGNKGELRAQAIHLRLSAEEVVVEAISHSGAVSFPIPVSICQTDCPLLQKGIHVAISMAAAQSLKDICECDGSVIYWTYSATDNTLTLNCNAYSISIFTEDVSECIIPDIEEADSKRLMLVSKDLYSAVRRVKVAGSKQMTITRSDDGLIEISDGSQGSVECVVQVTPSGSGTMPARLTLPVDTMLAALKAFDMENICINCNADSDYITLDDTGSMRCVVFCID